LALNIALQRIAIDRERQLLPQRHRALRAAEQAFRQCHGLANAAPQPNVKRPDQRNADDTGPRDTPRHTAGA
jgi:hypothetical protein